MQDQIEVMRECDKQCIRILARIFENGQDRFHGPQYAMEALRAEGMTFEGDVTWNGVMGMMQQYGVITDVETHNSILYGAFTITGRAVEFAKAIEHAEKKAAEPKDMVQHLTSSARKHPFVAWILIGFFVLTALATLANQTLQLLQNLGLASKP